jgi:hypothetical protein
LTKKTLHALTFAATREAAYVMKTDDDSFVNVTSLWGGILDACPVQCNNLYYGSLTTNYSVAPQSHKWQNAEYVAHMGGVEKYAPYMQGAGYVLSHTLVKMMMLTNQDTGLIVTPIEDASVGLWLAPYNVKRVHTSTIRNAQHWLEPLDDGTFVPWDNMCAPGRLDEFGHLQVVHKVTASMIRWLTNRPTQCQFEADLLRLGLSACDNRVEDRAAKTVLINAGPWSHELLGLVQDERPWELVELSRSDDIVQDVVAQLNVGHSQESPRVVLNACGMNGSEFELTEALVRSKTLRYVAMIRVCWHQDQRPTKAMWPHLFRRIAYRCGVSYQSNMQRERLYTKDGRVKRKSPVVINSSRKLT